MITIVIPNFNGEKFLPLCLGSMQNQTYKDFEIIVVDNHSSDASCSVVKKDYPDVRLVEMENNYGFSVAVNAGIKAAKGEFIALFNNDAYAEPTWLEELYNAIITDEKIGICGSKITYYFQPDIIDSAGVIIYEHGLTENRGNMEKDEGQYNKCEFIFGACAAAALYRKQMFDEISINGEVYDEDFFAYFEDADINMRSQLMGYKCLYVPTAVVRHIGSATNKRVKIRDGKPLLDTDLTFEEPKTICAGNYIFYYSARNYWNLIIKNMPNSFFLKKLPFALFFDLINHFIYSIRHKIFIMFLSTRISLIKQLPVMLKKRSFIMKNRKVGNEYIFSFMRKGGLEYYKKIFERFLENQRLNKREKC